MNRRDVFWMIGCIPLALTIWLCFRGWHFAVALPLAGLAYGTISVMVDQALDHIKERRHDK